MPEPCLGSGQCFFIVQNPKRYEVVKTTPLISLKRKKKTYSFSFFCFLFQNIEIVRFQGLLILANPLYLLRRGVPLNNNCLDRERVLCLKLSGI